MHSVFFFSSNAVLIKNLNLDNVRMLFFSPAFHCKVQVFYFYSFILSAKERKRQVALCSSGKCYASCVLQADVHVSPYASCCVSKLSVATESVRACSIDALPGVRRVLIIQRNQGQLIMQEITTKLTSRKNLIMCPTRGVNLCKCVEHRTKCAC